MDWSIGYFMATQILKYNLEFILHDARIYVFSILHMNSGLTLSVYYYYYYYYY
jgi:hypothetical protein